MSPKMLRHKPSGVLYVWQEAFAFRDDFEEVVEAPAPAAVSDDADAKPRKSRKAEPALVDEAALSADASRNLP